MTGTSTGGGSTPSPDPQSQHSDTTLRNIAHVVENFAPSPLSARPEPDYSVREASLSRALKIEPDAAKMVSELERTYPEIGEAMEVVWAHPTRSVGIVPSNHYNGQPSRDRFLNIPEHACAGIMVARAIGYFVLTDQTQLAELTKRAATDPLTKVGEALRREAGMSPQDIFSPSAYESERNYLIQNRGVPPEVADLIVSKHEVTGHRSFRNFIQVNPDGTFTVPVTNETIYDAILHLSDNMVHSTKPKQCDLLDEEKVTAVLVTKERMAVSLFHHPDDSIGYPWMWTKGLALCQKGQITEIPDVRNPEAGMVVIGSFAYLQGEIARQIAEPLKARIVQSGAALDTGEPAEQFILGLVRERLEAQG